MKGEGHMCTLGENIKNARKEADMTQEQLAKLLGIDQRTLSSYEIGTRNAGTDIVLQIATVLHTSVDKILRGEKLSEFIAEDDSMYPDIYKDDKLTIGRGLEILDGDIILAKVTYPDGKQKSIVRRIFRSDGVITLIATNRAVKPFIGSPANVEIVGTVTAVQRYLR